MSLSNEDPNLIFFKDPALLKILEGHVTGSQPGA